MRIGEFDFALPAGAIAQHPARPRDTARLLHLAERPEDRMVRDLPRLLQPGDLLVVNDTEVLPARLFGRRGEVPIEVTLIAEAEPGRWRALVRPARRLRPGDRIGFAPDFAAEVANKGENGVVLLDFACGRDGMIEKLEAYGTPPLPPYIRRAEPNPRDREDYRTVFAARPGAVAAPTAGLHFTPDLLMALDAAGIQRVAVTLHVGAGTFLPVRTERVEDHVMHVECFSVPEETAARVTAAKAEGHDVLA